MVLTQMNNCVQLDVTSSQLLATDNDFKNAKVKAAARAAYSGKPVVIASDFVANNILKVLNGEPVGTLFHKDAHMWIPATEIGPHEMAVSAREASRRLQALTSDERKKILLDVAAALEANEQYSHA